MLEAMIDIVVDSFYTTKGVVEDTSKVIEIAYDDSMRYLMPEVKQYHIEGSEAIVVLKKQVDTAKEEMIALRLEAIVSYGKQNITRLELEEILKIAHTRFTSTMDMAPKINVAYKEAMVKEAAVNKTNKDIENILYSPLIAAGAFVGSVTPPVVTVAVVSYAAYEIYTSDSGDYYAHIIVDSSIGAYYEVINFLS